MPADWIRYDQARVNPALIGASAVVHSLRTLPFQRSWANSLQEVQLRREVEGTSQIEGAEFVADELDEAIAGQTGDSATRSQKQVAAAVVTYRWIAGLPNDQRVNTDLICTIHSKMVTGADEDHCTPGRLRGAGKNVRFGIPAHRGALGGEECARSLIQLCQAFGSSFTDHDPIVQALAFHYHLAAIHPFEDGNGRTARAMEALLLQRTGLRNELFIAMSNYYNDERSTYIATLAEVRAHDYDLTPFLLFGLRGVEIQCKKLADEITTNVRKALFRNQMFDLFNRLASQRKRVIAHRQIEILKVLLAGDQLLQDLWVRLEPKYSKLRHPLKAFYRDIASLIGLRAISYRNLGNKKFSMFVRLEWPTEITEQEFFKVIKQLPKAKTYDFLS